jgi:hypothetical protein
VVTFREVLLDLMDLPGATYSCVADRVSGTLLGEVGTSSVPPGVVMESGSGAAAFLAAAGGDGLDDLMITSHRFYHLVRPVDVGPRQLVMIYLCLDRGRSNLAAARRELGAAWLRNRLAMASVGAPAQAPVPPPDVRPARPAPAAPPTARNGFSPAVALLSPPPGAGGRTLDRGRAPGPSGPPARSDPAPRRGASAHVPLPRRGPSRVPPPLASESVAVVHPLPGPSWATDVGTMRRLLTALQTLR